MNINRCRIQERRPGVAIYLIAVWAGTVVAADPLPLWLDQVIDQNQQVLAARQQWSATQSRIRATRSFADPMVGVDFMRMDSTRFDDIDGTEIMVSQRLPWWGQRRARTDTAQLLADAAGFRYLDVIRDTRAEMTQAYWNLWLARRTLALNEENRVLLQSFEQSAQARYESGDGIQADQLRAQVALAELDSELAMLWANVDIAQGVINRLLSLPPDTEHEIADEPELPELRWTLEEAYESARMYCCILMAYFLEREARETMVRQARLASRPEIELRVAARQESGSGSIREYNTGIAMNVPWVWRGKYRARVSEAERDLDRAEATLQAETDMTFLETKTAHAGAAAAWETVNRYQDSILPRTRELVASTQAAYENGKASFMELVDAQRQWNNAMLAEARARVRYASYVADLLALVEPWQDYELETGLIAEWMLH